jgi:hypothetical protein
MSHSAANGNRTYPCKERPRSSATRRQRLISGFILSFVLVVPAIAQPNKAITDPAHGSGPMRTTYVASVPAFDASVLPSLDSIDAQTDIKIFLHPDVPDDMRLPALRRAWSVNPAIRDFRGLAELDWDFNATNSAFGFGELVPGPQVEQMLAQMLEGTPMAIDQPAITVALVRESSSPSTVGLALNPEAAAYCTQSTGWGRIVLALLFCRAR